MPVWSFNRPVRTSTWITVILLVTFLAFAPSLDNGFVNWDDDVHLLENQAVRGLSLFDVGQMFRQLVNRIYIPLTTFSFALEYQIDGYNPFVYHFDNVLLHVVNTLLVLLVCRQLGLSVLGSGLAALIFGIHPVHVESVAWVTERKDVLYAFFYLLAVQFYLRYLSQKKKGLFALSWVCGLLSILAKPMALSLPLILLLCDWYFDRQTKREAWLEKLYFLLYIVPITWLTYLWNARIPSMEIVSGLLTWTASFSFYIKHFILPDPLLALYRLPRPVALTEPFYIAALVLFLTVAASLFIFRKSRLYIFGIGYFFLSIFFLLRFDIYDANVVGDRFLYLPMLGFCIIAAIVLEKLLVRASANRYGFTAAALALALVTFGWMAKTSAQCDVWQNGLTLWRHQLKNAPLTAPALVYHKMGQAYTQREKFKRTAQRLRAYYQGDSRRASGKDFRRAQKALNWQFMALDIKPDMAQAYFFIGKIFYDIGRPQEAEDYYQKALFYHPNYFQVYMGLARLYHEHGRLDEAMAAYAKAAEIDRYNPYSVGNIKNLYNDVVRERQGQ